MDFAGIQRLQAAGEWAAAGELLAADARALQDAGADLVLLCTNTMHTVADAVTGAIDVPFLHIADTTAEAITAAGLTRVGLLGTGYTMAQPFLVDRLAAAGLEVLVPEQADRDLVHRVIYEELVLGVVREESRQAYQEVVGRLMARGAQGVVLGCTEIELLIGPDDVPVPTFPTTALHAAAAVRAALGEAPTASHRSRARGGTRQRGRSSTSPAPHTIDR
ncbi:aspartate/glutamate racemase family protein [Blastococcus sp. KM273128]|uniref:aspartate/glutamate racemase family protein n=1 Tax=Blastococcus sp. KM273128 TaxID=2570314 RepID=UPI001F000212|nr:amino acid racemase [Blastococcus sp. KM273128]